MGTDTQVMERATDVRVSHRASRVDAVSQPVQERQLQPNPFTAYRDPETGRWLVIKPVAA